MKDALFYAILTLVIFIMGAIILVGTLYPGGIGNPSGHSLVTVTARGQATAVPDEAVVYIEVNGSGASPKLAVDNLTMALDRLNLTLYKYVGGNASLIKTISYTMNKAYNRSSYEAQEFLEARLYNMQNVSPMLGALASLSDVYVLSVSSRLSEAQGSGLESEALLNAMDNATEQARVLTGNATLTVKNITAENYFAPYPGIDMLSASSGGPSYSAGTEEVTVSITVSFLYNQR